MTCLRSNICNISIQERAGRWIALSAYRQGCEMDFRRSAVTFLAEEHGGSFYPLCPDQLWSPFSSYSKDNGRKRERLTLNKMVQDSTVKTQLIRYWSIYY